MGLKGLIRLMIGLGLSAQVLKAAATPYPFGEAMTTGLGSNGSQQAYLGTNPAMLDAVSGINRGFSVQIANVGFVAEAGRAETLADDFDALNMGDATIETLGQTVDDLNGFLDKVGDKAYFDLEFGADVLSPLSYSFGQNGGTLALNAGAMAGSNLSLLGGEVSINRTKLQAAMIKQTLGQEISNNDLLDILRMTASVYVKTKTELNLAFGYGKTVYRDKEGGFAIGSRVHFHQLSLSKGLLPFKQYLQQEMNHADDPDNYPDSALDTLISDVKRIDKVAQSALVTTVDVGVAWYSERYDFGLTFKNINQPTVDFPVLGRDCEASESPVNCYFAAALKDQIELSERSRYSLQPRFEAHIFTPKRNWTLGGYFEAWAEDQPLGPKSQWTGVSIVYAKPLTKQNWYYSWLIPSSRLGYHVNLAGSQYRYYALGLSWLGVHLDIMADDTLIDGSNALPHVFGASLGISYRF